MENITQSSKASLMTQEHTKAPPLRLAWDDEAQLLYPTENSVDIQVSINWKEVETK